MMSVPKVAGAPFGQCETHKGRDPRVNSACKQRTSAVLFPSFSATASGSVELLDLYVFSVLAETRYGHVPLKLKPIDGPCQPTWQSRAQKPAHTCTASVEDALTVKHSQYIYTHTFAYQGKDSKLDRDPIGFERAILTVPTSATVPTRSFGCAMLRMGSK